MIPIHSIALRIRNDGLYNCDSHYDDRLIPKALGFRWNPERRVWWTDRIEKACALTHYIQSLNRANGVERVEAPPGLSYLPYQREAIEFALARPGVLIADEPGLGKTIEAIGVFNADPSISSVLVLCPASLKLNWQREFEKWAVRNVSIGIASGKCFPETEVVVCNYDIAAKHRNVIDGRQWDLLIADEAHYLKNPKAVRTGTVLGGGEYLPIIARRRFFMTGTPIVNRPRELWAIVRALDTMGLGLYQREFEERYCGGHKIYIFPTLMIMHELPTAPPI